MPRIAALLGALLVSGCVGELPLATRIANADPATSVTARAETAPVGTAAQDAADDPAIWRNPPTLPPA